MKKNWYKKTVLSYIPTLYLTIAIVVFIAIFVVSEISMKEAERTNKYSSEYIVNTLEASLSTVERRMLDELRIGDVLFDFFEVKNHSNDGYDGILNFEANKKLRQLVSEFPFIQSMYLYRAQDNQVLSMHAFESLEEFGDQDFILNELKRYSFNRSWSLPRIYRDTVGVEAQNIRVISFSQRTQLPLGNQGLIVVNVSLDALLANIDKMIDPSMTYLEIVAGEDMTVYSSAGNTDSHEVMNEYKSNYLQWHFSSGIQSGLSFASLQLISRIWIAIGLLCIIGSFIYTVLITKRNYRPIENIIRQIQSFQEKRVVEKGVAPDEFSFIQKAIERLNDENMQYEAEVQVANQHKRKQHFQQLLESYQTLDEARWEDSLESIGLSTSFKHAFVTVIEIDQYKTFEQKYKKAYDQGLIKFAMNNVLHEYMQGAGKTWSEWTRLNRFSVIHVFEDRVGSEECLTRLEKFRVWVAVNLGLTVTIGIGEPALQWSEMQRSYNEAVEALQFKRSYGYNRTLFYREITASRSNNIHVYYQEMNALAHDFRLGNSDWSERLQHTLTALKLEVLTNEENLHLMQYFKSLLDQLVEKLPSGLKQQWLEHTMAEWDSLIHVEYMGDSLPRLQTVLLEAHQAYIAHVQSKDSKQSIHDIRSFVEENFMNPELSLNLISEKFKLNSKYISQLFKEQLGINFADFVIELRINHAKGLLLTTESSINEIALQVGYEIPLSFGRAFKKHVGVSPSDYRKNMGSVDGLKGMS